MISSELYANFPNARGNYDGRNVQCTTTIPTLSTYNIIIPDYTDAYWLGWMHFDNYPKLLGASEFFYDDSDDTFGFRSITGDSEYPNIGYAITNHADYYGSAQTVNNTVYQWYDIAPYTGAYDSSWNPHATGNARNIRFLNSFPFQKYSIGSIKLILCRVDPSIDDSTTAWFGNITVTIYEYIQFIKNNATLTWTIIGNNYSLQYSNFDENGIYHDETNDLYFFLVSAELNRTATTISENQYSSTATSTQLFTMSDIYADEDKTIVYRKTFAFGGNTYQLASVNKALTTFTRYSDVYAPLLNANNYNVDSGSLADLPYRVQLNANGVFSTSDFAGAAFPVIRGNVIAVRNTSQSTYTSINMYVAIHPLDLYHFFSLFRWYSPAIAYSDCPQSGWYNIAGYSNNLIWYPEVDLETNEFKGELITGNESEIIGKLTEWEKGLINATTSTFNPADKPTPEPPQGENIWQDGNEVLGDSFSKKTTLSGVTGNTLTTYYDLSLSDVFNLIDNLTNSASTFWEALGTSTDYKQQNILDYIVSLRKYPFQIHDTLDSQATKLQFGYNANAQINLGTVSPSYKLSSTVKVFSLGELTVSALNGGNYTERTFLDFEPYTTCRIYLPFMGEIQLRCIDVIGRSISIYMMIDIVTGMGTYYVYNDAVALIFEGTCKIGAEISVAGNDIVSQSERMAGSYINAAENIFNKAIVQNEISSETPLLDYATNQTTAVASAALSFTAGMSTTVAREAMNISSARRAIPQRVSEGSGFGNMFCDYTPKIIVEKPALVIPATYGHEVGYPLNQSRRISELSGFVICDRPDLSGIDALEEEKVMIGNLLMNGFYA